MLFFQSFIFVLLLSSFFYFFFFFNDTATTEIYTLSLHDALPPSVSLADGLPSAPGLPVRLLATEHRHRVGLTSEYAGAVRSVEFGISPAYGWTMLLPFDLAVGDR